MSLKKCEKFVRNTEGFDSDLPPLTRQPILLGDSKVGYLKTAVTSYIENQIILWYGGGWDSETGLNYLLDNIDGALQKYRQIHLYVWLGTCNLTKKINRFVYLNPKRGNAQLIYHLELISKVADSKKFKVTFLEIPFFSLRKWNIKKGHRAPETFRVQDKLLQARTKVANEHIQRINRLNRAGFRSLNVDLEVTRKNRGRKGKKYYTHKLYTDGIHPNHDLSKCWLRKLTLQIKLDCC